MSRYSYQDGRWLEYRRTAETEAMTEELAHDLRAGARLAGDGGLNKKLWGRGKPKGLVGS